MNKKELKRQLLDIEYTNMILGLMFIPLQFLVALSIYTNSNMWKVVTIITFLVMLFIISMSAIIRNNLIKTNILIP